MSISHAARLRGRPAHVRWSVVLLTVLIAATAMAARTGATATPTRPFRAGAHVQVNLQVTT